MAVFVGFWYLVVIGFELRTLLLARKALHCLSHSTSPRHGCLSLFCPWTLQVPFFTFLSCDQEIVSVSSNLLTSFTYALSLKKIFGSSFMFKTILLFKGWTQWLRRSGRLQFKTSSKPPRTKSSRDPISVNKSWVFGGALLSSQLHRKPT
jgi:hypothetical protein